MKKVLVLFLFLLPAAPAVCAQAESGKGVWSALSTASMDPSKTAVTENVSIVRDRVRITLVNGSIQFVKPVNGVVFGAVFHGEGHLQVDPPNRTEAQQLQLFAKQDKLALAFTDATFSFTDDLFEEVGKQVKWRDGGAGDDFYAKRQQEREDLGAEYLPRLFMSVMSPDRKRTAYFMADFKSKGNNWIEVRDDSLQPEEIRVGRWADVGPFKLRDYWLIFPAGNRDPHHVYDDPAAHEEYLLPEYHITTTVTDGAELSSTARVTVQPRYAGERVLLFNLDSNLRVSSVKDAQGRPLEFIQARERKDRYQSYGSYVAVSLIDPTRAGQTQVIEFQYAGKKVVRKVGDGNYFCESSGWYPAFFEGELGVDQFAFRSSFDLTFHSPKKYKLVATGLKVSETVDGKELVTNWKNDVPLTVAGFAFGDYKVVTDKVGDVEVQVYANNQPDDTQKMIQRFFENPADDLASGPNGSHTPSRGAIGNLSPSGLGKTINVETANTLRVFQPYFGPYPYKTLAVTNISGGYGQGWPGLLYLSWLTFLDSTQRNELGIRNQTQISDYFRAHESSHQWWGQRVSWKSYHDQWLSEGFAEFSGLLFVQYRQNMKESLTQFRLTKELLGREDLNRHKTEEFGPIWMGRRVMASDTDQRSYQDLIYSKGAYVLQMLRAQLMDPRNPDPEHLFKDMLMDYTRTYSNQAASTEDFKAIAEKHMTRAMDLDGNHKLDWFFNQYVYGTGMPKYELHVTLTPTPDGKTTVAGELDRSGVPDTWKDVLPIYAHVGDKVVRLGTLAAQSPKEPINFALPGKIDKLTMNDFEDVLGTVKQ